MFEKLRSNLSRRLSVLIDRFENIERRSKKLGDEGRLAIRLGLGGSTQVYDEIAGKSFEQAALCGEAITALLVHRSWPLTFRSGVKRAELFADQCELIINQSEAGAAAGRAAFKQQLDPTER